MPPKSKTHESLMAHGCNVTNSKDFSNEKKFSLFKMIHLLIVLSSELHERST